MRCCSQERGIRWAIFGTYKPLNYENNQAKYHVSLLYKRFLQDDHSYPQFPFFYCCFPLFFLALYTKLFSSVRRFSLGFSCLHDALFVLNSLTSLSFPCPVSNLLKILLVLCNIFLVFVSKITVLSPLSNHFVVCCLKFF